MKNKKKRKLKEKRLMNVHVAPVLCIEQDYEPPYGRKDNCDLNRSEECVAIPTTMTNETDDKIPIGKYCPTRGKQLCAYRSHLGHVPFCTKFNEVITQGKTKESQVKIPKCMAMLNLL